MPDIWLILLSLSMWSMTSVTDDPMDLAAFKNSVAMPAAMPPTAPANAASLICEADRPLSRAAVSAPRTTRSAPMTAVPAMSVRLSLDLAAHRQHPVPADGHHFFRGLRSTIADQQFAQRHALLAFRRIGDEVGKARAGVVLAHPLVGLAGEDDVELPRRLAPESVRIKIERDPQLQEGRPVPLRWRGPFGG